MRTERERKGSLESLHLQRIHIRALSLLHLHYPFFVPQEQTAIHFARLGDGGMYGGSYHGTHHSFLPRSHDKVTEDGETSNVIHELVHQRHAEVVGEELFLTYSTDKEAKRRKFRHLSDGEIVWAISREMTGQMASNLSDAIAEGLAIVIETDILVKELEIAQSLGRISRVKNLKSELRYEKRRRRELKDKGNREAWIVLDGIEMLERLTEFFGEDQEALANFIFSVDLAQTNEIKYQSPEYVMMVEDPLLLPRVA